MPMSLSRFDPARVPVASQFFRDNVQRYQSRGKRATGLCPFHEDRNPSLSIDLERGLWYCFVCAEGGDIPKFVQRRDSVSFPTAARSLGAWRDHELTTSERE